MCAMLHLFSLLLHCSADLSDNWGVLKICVKVQALEFSSKAKTAGSL